MIIADESLPILEHFLPFAPLELAASVSLPIYTAASEIPSGCKNSLKSPKSPRAHAAGVVHCACNTINRQRSARVPRTPILFRELDYT